MKNSSKLLRLVIAISSMACLFGLIAFAVLFLFPSNARDNQDPAKQKEMVAIILEWGRLAPFPATATNIAIETDGGSSTRSFRASFIASRQDIQAWIKESPGLNEATVEESSNNKTIYTITPGGGANMAEVTIDYSLNKVDIYVSWS
jgi:hypothetical protein